MAGFRSPAPWLGLSVGTQQAGYRTANPAFHGGARTAIQGGLIKLMQTTAAKVEYTGIGLDMRIVALNDKLSETISLLLDNSSEFRGITAFSVTNSDKLRDSRSTDL